MDLQDAQKFFKTSLAYLRDLETKNKQFDIDSADQYPIDSNQQLNKSMQS